uniref:Uncharacterized protein n=1 Tax=Hanusia phi TaxID=3032 RepID=A0A7S0F667_9CRYP|mmetsp:Transcript_36355/g.81972  ORF Transcript_36355/g.81972 Transcript_36355/m.81972 type:complete len:282 (+) Transcript_36355:35-880(+)
MSSSEKSESGAVKKNSQELAEPPSKPSLQLLCSTLNTLWGSDRVLRSIQFFSRLLASSPELSAENRHLCEVIGRSFSQARYINRLYGTIDGLEGVVYDIPRNAPFAIRLAKFLIHGVGGIGYHVLEHTALAIMIVRRCDPEKIPSIKAALQRWGLWDKADDIDALAQWCWFLEALAKLYIASLSYRRIKNQIAVAMAAGDKAALKRLVVLRRMLLLDMIKLGTDLPLSVHYARMYDNGPSTLPERWVGILGVLGSVSQFLVRYKQQSQSYSLDLCLSNKFA